MQWLAQVCVRRPVFAAVLMLVIVVIGIAGYMQLGLDELPNADVPVVVVSTRLAGAAPEEVETDITDKIEGAVNTISGIDELRSSSSEGISQVVLNFSLEKSLDVAAQDVRDKISTVLPDLPQGIDQPVVSKVDLNAAPVLLVTLRGNMPIRELTELADKKVRRRIESIDGVGQVNVRGGRKRQVNVFLDPLGLRGSGLSVADVDRAIRAQNLTTPGGNLLAGPEDLSVRVQGRVASVDALRRLVLRNEDGHSLRLGDVARVEDGEEEARSAAEIDGKPAVVLSIRKQAGENTVAVVDAVKERLAEIQRTLPPGAELEIIADNAETIRTSVHAVTEHLIVGGVLAALVVLVFLGNARSTVIAAIAIPISIIGTFALMWAMGFTLNVLTLLALALAVGIVVDDAIVVLENIVRHVDELKEKPFVAAVLATREIGLAVLATTLSLLAVFLPVAFMSGLVGRFLKSFGLTMAFSIAVSMIVSFSLTPMLSARWIHPAGDTVKKSLLERSVDVVYRPIERVYMAMLRWAMRHRWVVVLACVVPLASLVPLAGSLTSGFMPPDDKAQFEVNVRGPEGTSLEEMRLAGERVAADIQVLTGVRHVLLQIGADEQETKNFAKVSVYLVRPEERQQSQLALMERVRREVVPRAPKEFRITAGEIQGVSTGDAASQNIQYALTGPDLEKLKEFGTRITDELRKVPGAVDVDNNLIVGKPELSIGIDRERAADLGVQVADVAEALRIFLAGQKVSSYAERGEEYDIRLRAEPASRRDPSVLELLTVPSPKGPVSLAAVTMNRPGSAAAQINRLARSRQVSIFANSAPGVGDSAVEGALTRIAADLHMPQGYALAPVGFSKEQSRTVRAFGFAFALSFVFMYLILAAQFESWIHPITILISLPLTVPFGLASLHLFGQGINLFTALGLLVLFGVVKKNAILQIDHTNHLRREGHRREEAILDANRDRLRPILMTTIAFVAGMIPLITASGIGAGQNQAIAGIVLGGQTFSLLLTLLAVPVFYSLFDDAASWVARRRKARADRGEQELDALLGESRTEVEPS